MKSKPRRRRQVNKQALQDETKEAARKQFSGAALSFTTVLLFTFIYLFFFTSYLSSRYVQPKIWVL